MKRWFEPWFSLSERQRMTILNLVALTLLFMSWQNLLRPQSTKLVKLRSESKQLHAQRASIQAELPDLEQTHQKMERQVREIKALEQRLNDLESALPTTETLGQLLGKLVAQGEGFEMTFETVKQRKNKDPDFPEVAIELIFHSSFEGLVNYIRRVEQLASFLRVAHFEVTESKEEPGKDIRTQLTLVTPLRLALEIQQPFVLGTPSGEKIFLPRSPFISQKQPEDVSWLEELKVSGITWRHRAATAIVNDQVIRVGDQVNRLVVKQILPEQVIFSDGKRSYTVPINR